MQINHLRTKGSTYFFLFTFLPTLPLFLHTALVSVTLNRDALNLSIYQESKKTTQLSFYFTIGKKVYFFHHNFLLSSIYLYLFLNIKHRYVVKFLFMHESGKPIYVHNFHRRGRGFYCFHIKWPVNNISCEISAEFLNII